MYLPIYLHIYLPTYLSIYLSINLPTYIYLYLPIYSRYEMNWFYLQPLTFWRRQWPNPWRDFVRLHRFKTETLLPAHVYFNTILHCLPVLSPTQYLCGSLTFLTFSIFITPKQTKKKTIILLHVKLWIVTGQNVPTVFIVDDSIEKWHRLYPCTILTDCIQCDQIDCLCLQFWPFTTMKLCAIPYIILPK